MENFENKGLTAAALFVLLIAVISQWIFGFHATGYYDDSAWKNLDESHKNFSYIDFKCESRLDTK